MRVTEEKAYGLLCVHSRSSTNYNNCLASGCMAWRWDGNDGRYQDNGVVMVPTQTGYCGLVEQHHTHPKGDDEETT